MKRNSMIAVLLAITFIFAGCGLKLQSPIAKKDKPEPMVEKKAEEDVLVGILSKKDGDDLQVHLAYLLRNGRVEKRETTSKRFLNGQTLTYEKWLVSDAGENYHVVVIENKILSGIEPINEVKDWDKYQPFWKKYSPVGGWNK